MPASPSHPVAILLAEDNPADVRLVQEVLRESEVAHEVHVVRDGVETLDFLRHRGLFSGAPPVGLVLLDLSMPRKDGREVLVEMKADPELRRTPVVVMTSSPAEEDIMHAYNHHANCYIRKPVDFESFRAVVREIEQFWFAVVALPPH
jgi:chemotaxis family two-component system response regulator Rcp1